MKTNRWLRGILVALGGLFAILVILAAVLALAKIPIDLSRFKSGVSEALSSAMGRAVAIDGNVMVTTSVAPVFTLEGLRIANPDGFPEAEFLSLKSARIQIKLLPLLQSKIHIPEVRVDGFTANLRENRQGQINWVFGKKSTDEPPPPKAAEPPQDSEKARPALTSDAIVISKLRLTGIAVTYQNMEMAEPRKVDVKTCSGIMPPGSPFKLSLKGALQDEPVAVEIEIGSLKELVEENRSWMGITADIAETRIELTGGVDMGEMLKRLDLKAAVSGKRLDNLNALAGLDLPPFQSYGLGAQLTLEKGRLELKDTYITVGQSRLEGDVTIDNTGARPTVAATLISSMIQLQDFDLEGWSPGRGTTSPQTQERMPSDSPKPQAPEPSSPPPLLSADVLERFDARFEMSAEKIMSGRDELGGGRMTVSVEAGQLVVRPLQIDIPGGSFQLAASLKPGGKNPEATLEANIDRFDFGVLVRRLDPEADIGGILNLDLDLKSSASSFEELMATANGHFNFSGRLENLRAGIVDLWAVNLIAAIVSSQKDPSHINCVLGRLKMQDGQLVSEAIVIDTSNIRICGKGQVDFTQRNLQLVVRPKAKKPAYFSLATPLEVEGDFDDFGIGIKAGGLFGTAIRVIASPVTTSVKKLVGRRLPEDGRDVCTIPIDPAYQIEGPIPGCR
jgi:uncharacterized protein involved in outer membrane biogenesis